jgi:hypothetical protein
MDETLLGTRIARWCIPCRRQIVGELEEPSTIDFWTGRRYRGQLLDPSLKPGHALQRVIPACLQLASDMHRVAILAAFGTLDMNQHPFAADRVDLQAHHLADPQACRIARRQRYAIARSRNRVQETRDLPTVEYRWKLLGLLAGYDPLERLFLTERDAVARDLIDV